MIRKRVLSSPTADNPARIIQFESRLASLPGLPRYTRSALVALATLLIGSSACEHGTSSKKSSDEQDGSEEARSNEILGELEVFRANLRGEVMTEIRTRDGIKHAVDEALKRYSAAMGLDPGLHTFVRTTRKTRLPGGKTRTFYQLQYRGVDVFGRGLHVESQAGNFVYARGTLDSPNLGSVAPIIGKNEALSLVLDARFPNTPPPWEKDRKRYKPPTVTLFVQNVGSKTSPHFDLIWELKFENSGVRIGRSVVSATSGKIYETGSGLVY